MECLLRQISGIVGWVDEVLILILMECLLSLDNSLFHAFEFSLNPYSNGMLT